MKELKKLEQYNKVISRGRVGSALHMSIFLTIGISIGNILAGKHGSIFYTSWITFAMTFMISYLFFSSNSYIRKASLLVTSLGEGQVASPPKSERKSWIFFFVIFSVLISPFVFKNQIRELALNYIETAVLEVRVEGHEDGPVVLKIPQMYVLPKLDIPFNKFSFYQDVPKISLLAKWDDMSPLDIKSFNRQPVNRTVHGFKTNPNILAIEMHSQSVDLNSRNIDFLSNEMSQFFDNPENVSVTQDMALNIKSGKMSIPHPNGKGVLRSFAHLAVPDDPNYRDILIACERGSSCVLVANVPSVSIIHVYFHHSRMKDWKEVYEKAISLIESFIKKD